MAEIVSGYDTENSYNFDILNPMIMMGNQYPLTTDEVDNMKTHYIEKLNIVENQHYTNTDGQIIGYITEDDSDYPLFCVDRRVMDVSRDTRTKTDGISIHTYHNGDHKPFLSCYKTEKTYFVELSFLEHDEYAILSLIDLYVLYLEDLAKNFLSGEIIELLISQITEHQKHLGFMKYYKEFC